MDPVVRPARLDDVAELRLLEAEARVEAAGARGGARWLEEHGAIDDGWATSLEHKDVFVAQLDGPPDLVVGYLVVDVVGDVATVDQVWVTPEARELGFGDALLEAAEARAVARGARVLEGYALPGDRHTKNLYERAGITARLITVSRALSAPSSSGPASR